MGYYTDEKLYWAWRETPEECLQRIKSNIPVPPTPTVKVLDYKESCDGEHKMCIGVWDDDVYTELYRDGISYRLLFKGELI